MEDLFPLVQLAVFVLIAAGGWKMFTKANKPGWAFIVPFYNLVVMMQVVGRPLWWVLLLFIPFVNLIVVILLCADLAKSFGKGIGFAIGIFFLSMVFIPILGFGEATYMGPAAAKA